MANVNDSSGSRDPNLRARPSTKRAKSVPVGVHDGRSHLDDGGVGPRRPASYNRRLDPGKREIRLLTLLPPRRYDTRPEGKLETVSLTDDLEFIALSYAWGDPGVTDEVIIDGAVVDVTVNLAAALWYFKEYDMLRGIPDGRPLPIWIDAVCIDQHDLDERAQQVAFMRDIYSSAKHVFSWLGPPKAGRIDIGLGAIRDVMQAYRRISAGLAEADNDDEVWKARSKSGSGSSNSELSYFAGPDEAMTKVFAKALDQVPELRHKTSTSRKSKFFNLAWDSFLHLNRSDYWERLWVYQEMALARLDHDCHQILCGPVYTAMPDVTRFFHFCRLLTGLTRPESIDATVWEAVASPRGYFTWCGIATDEVRHMRSKFFKHQNLGFWLLYIAKGTRAADPRDMIYGLTAVLGLDIKPDYTISAKDVYLRWALLEYESILDNEFRLLGFFRHLLQFSCLRKAGAWLEEGGVVGLPSWLPDLSMLSAEGCPWPHRAVYKCTNNTEPFAPLFRISAEGVMSTKGAVCGTISGYQQGPARFLPDTAQCMKQIFRLSKKVMRSVSDYWRRSESYKTGCSLEQAIMFTVLYGINPHTDDILDTKDWAQLWDFVQSCGTAVDLDYDDMEAPFPDTSARKLAFDITEYVDETARCRIFWTDNDYIGLIPTLVEPGDRLCVVNGCTFPIVSRKVDRGWVHIGACYVYDISGLQPIDVIKRDELEVQTFDIY
ncbi:SUMO protein smt3 [Pestalotiopsis sp. IQ-011]